MSLSGMNKLAARGGPTRRAAPAGGARNRGRGCHILSILVAMSGLAVATPLPVAASATDTPIETPSGLTVYLQEFIEEPGLFPLLRARFVAPTMTADTPEPETVLGDMEHLCNTVAIPHAQVAGEMPTQIVVSVSAEAMEFGTLDPDIPQYFEAYSVQDGTCMWELY